MTTGNPFKRATPGGKIVLPAQAWNDALDAGRDHRFSRSAKPGRPVRRGRKWDTLVYNSTGGTLGSFAVVALGDPLTTPTGRLATFQQMGVRVGSVPASADRCRLAVLQEACRDGGVARAMQVGVTPVLLDLGDEPEAPVDWADVLPGETSRLSWAGLGQARVTWLQALEDRDEETPELAWALVRLGEGGAPMAKFTVFVTVDGGEAGGGGEHCTFTYTVKDCRGRVLGETMVPQVQRLAFQEYVTNSADTPGDGYYDEDGLFVLYDANEVPAVEECPADGEDVTIDGGTP